MHQAYSASGIKYGYRSGKQCRYSTSLNFSPRYIANLIPTLSYCKSVNNFSPNMQSFKVDRYEKLYFDPFFLAVRFGLPCTFAYSYCTMPMLIMTCPAFCPRSALLFLCPLLICTSALSCPVLPYPVLSCPACKLSNFWPKRS